jgi:hypothetical protein
MEQHPHIPKTRFRLLIIVSILLGGLWAAAWVTASALAPGFVRAAVTGLTATAEGLGVGLRDVSVKTTHVSFLLNGIELEELTARFDLNLLDKNQPIYAARHHSGWWSRGAF